MIGDAAFLQSVYDGRLLLIADSRAFYEGGVIGDEEKKIGVMVQAVSPVLDICADAVHYDDIVAEGEIYFHFRTGGGYGGSRRCFGELWGTEGAEVFAVCKSAGITLHRARFLHKRGSFFQSPPAAYKSSA